MKTVRQALRDEVHYPMTKGFVENKIIERGLDGSATYTVEIFRSSAYRGALADCLCSLIHAVNFSESDKSVGNLTDEQRKQLLKRANALYEEIGEPTVDDGEPMVYFGVQ